MSNSKFRCAACRTYHRQPAFRTTALGSICSPECATALIRGTATTRARPIKQQKSKTTDVPTAVRQAVALRDGGKCRYCGTTIRLTQHHVRYRSEGVDHQAHNLVTLCGPGNADGCHGIVHSNKKKWKKICLAYIWLVTVEGRRFMLPEIERMLSREQDG